MFKKISLILSSICLWALPTWANTHHELRNFSTQFAQNWIFDCGHQLQTNYGVVTEAEMNAFYRQEALVAVQKGLNDLSILNPQLFNAVVERSKGKKLKWGCDTESKLSKASAGYYTRPFLFFSKKFIAITGSTLDVAAENYIQQNYSNKLQRVILHEFYHNAGLDNRSISQHGHGSTQLKLGEFLDDVVYACAAQTYPNLFYEIKSDGTAYKNSVNVCSVCATAIPKRKSRTKLPHNFQILGRNACEHINDQDYYAGTMKMSKSGYMKFESLAVQELLKEHEEKLAEIKADSEEFDRMLDRLLFPDS